MRCGVAGKRTDLRSPGAEEFAHPRLVLGVADGAGIRDPEIELERAVARSAHLFGPGADFFGCHQERAAGAQAAAIRYCNGEGGSAGASQRRQEDRYTKAEPVAKCARAISNAHGESSGKLESGRTSRTRSRRQSTTARVTAGYPSMGAIR